MYFQSDDYNNTIIKNKKINKEIIVINDGSKDKTAKILKKVKGIKVFNLKRNMKIQLPSNKFNESSELKSRL